MTGLSQSTKLCRNGGNTLTVETRLVTSQQSPLQPQQLGNHEKRHETQSVIPKALCKSHCILFRFIIYAQILYTLDLWDMTSNFPKAVTSLTADNIFHVIYNYTYTISIPHFPETVGSNA